MRPAGRRQLLGAARDIHRAAPRDVSYLGQTGPSGCPVDACTPPKAALLGLKVQGVRDKAESAAFADAARERHQFQSGHREAVAVARGSWRPDN